MDIELRLVDDTDDWTLPLLQIPLTENTIENATDVQTLDGNVHTNFIGRKRSWQHNWYQLSEADFNRLKGFYERQFTLFKYPRIYISYYTVNNIPVRMTLNPKTIIDNCGTVRNVTITLRETTQI